jgi:hypothetical protein
MVVHTPILVEPGGTDAPINFTAQEFRQFMTGLIASRDGFANQQGVIGANDLVVSQNGTPNLTVNVSAGQAFVLGDDLTAQGLYFVWNDAVVNVPGFTVPPSGTYTHRVCLQVQDKLSLGSYTGYGAALIAVVSTDTSGNAVAEPADCITLATISISSAQSSIATAQITDQRQRTGPFAARKASDTTRTSTTTLADDPGLQLLNLQVGGHYIVEAGIVYNATAGGDMTFGWDANSAATFKWNRSGLDVGGTPTNGFAFNLADTVNAGGQGVSQDLYHTIAGQFDAGSTGPCFLIFKWAQHASNATGTTIRQRSWIRCRRQS